MKGYPEKQLGLNKPEHINPKGLGITCPSADPAITSWCISLSNGLVASGPSPSRPWPPRLPCRAQVAEERPICQAGLAGAFQAQGCNRSNQLPDRAAAADLQTGTQKVGSSISPKPSTMASREINLSFPTRWKKDELQGKKRKRKRPSEASFYPSL